MTAQQLRQPVQPSVDAAAINAGTNVYSYKGDQLGIVGDVWAYIPPYGYVAKSKFGVANYGPIRGTMHLFDGAGGYVQVLQRNGMRREGDTDLYIPLDQVQNAVDRLGLVVTSLQTDNARVPSAIAG